MTERSRSASRRPVASLALTLAALTLAVACVPTPVARTSPGPAGATPVPTATAVPSPTGPTPVPSFIRPTPTPVPTFALYTVVAGDTLSSIAQRYGTTARSLAYWNRTAHPSLDPESEGYAPDRIAIGWVLQLIPNTVIDEEEVDGSPSSAPSSLPTVAPTAAGTLQPVGAASVVVSHGDRASRKVALTFDMGGRLDAALDILGFLVDSDVGATVFPTGLTGSTTEDGTAVLELVAEHREQFVLGNHSWSHPDFRELDDAAMRDQLDRTEAAILGLVNISTKPYFRPPYGALDDQIPATVGAAGWGYTVLWDVDTIDWKPEADGGPTTQQIVDTVLTKAQGGSIVLMHLGGYHTLDALPGILSGLEAKGLTPVTLDDLLSPA